MKSSHITRVRVCLYAYESSLGSFARYLILCLYLAGVNYLTLFSSFLCKNDKIRQTIRHF